MLVFVIPLKSQKVSKSWDAVCKLFERSVKSVCHQTSDNFRVIVVCHEKPQIEFNHPYLHYLEVDFPIPGQNFEIPELDTIDKKGRPLDVISKDIDKGRKILTGLAYANKFAPSHAMIVDADDCVSRRLAEFVNQNSQCNGWFLEKGYMYNEGNMHIYLRSKDFGGMCGTSIIIKYGLYDLLFNKYDYNHQATVLPNGIILEPLPFVGAVYTKNQQNIYYTDGTSTTGDLSVKGRKDFRDLREKFLRISKNLTGYRLLTKSIRSEFGLYNILIH